MMGMQPHDVFMFWMGQPEFVEDPDLAALKKSFTTLGKFFLLGSVTGIFINVKFKRIPKIKFLNWNRFLRYAFRIPLFCAPYFCNLGLQPSDSQLMKNLKSSIKYIKNIGEEYNVSKKQGIFIILEICVL